MRHPYLRRAAIAALSIAIVAGSSIAVIASASGGGVDVARGHQTTGHNK